MTGESKFSPIKQQKVYSQIIEQFMSLIKQGEFYEGMQLPSERSLALQLEVSRASLREALTVLQLRGVIETVPGMGSVIKTSSDSLPIQFDVNTFSQEESPFVIIQARQAIEPANAFLAAQNRTGAMLENIRKILLHFESDLAAERLTYDVFSRCDRDFHLCIAEATGNPILIHVQKVFHSLMHQQLWLAIIGQTSLSTPGRWRESGIEHRNIFEAIENQDGEKAEVHMRKHLSVVQTVMEEAELVSKLPDDMNLT